MFIAHDLSVVRFISNRIAVIHQGNIVELAEAELKHFYAPYTRSLLSARLPCPTPSMKKKLLVYNPPATIIQSDKPA